MKDDLIPYLKQEVTLTLPLGAVLRLSEERIEPLVAHAAPLVHGGRILPAIGADWEGGKFAGVTLADDALFGLVLLPEEAKNVDWPAAKAWAEDRGGTLPSRIDHLILLRNMKGEFSADDWYWSSEEVAGDAVFAWGQGFGYGNQGNWHKSSKRRARAVRRAPI